MRNFLHPFIVILGAGSWGTALALHLAREKQSVRLWTKDQEHAAEMMKERINKRYLPHHIFPESLHITSDLAEAVSDGSDILIATPSSAFREILTLLQPLISIETRIAWATKGLDLKTGQLLHHVAREILSDDRSYALLSGPSFALEVAAGLPTAVVIASEAEDFARDLRSRFNSYLFRIYFSTDIIGVEIGGIVKNVLAIAAGIADGMHLGANARSALITRGLAEMTRLGVALGSQPETFTGLTGLGDLVLTCTDDKSRNRRFGLALGQGKSMTEAESSIGQVIEGKRNAELLVALARKNEIEMPITEIVWKILQDELSPQQAMQMLLSRNPTTE